MVGFGGLLELLSGKRNSKDRCTVWATQAKLSTPTVCYLGAGFSPTCPSSASISTVRSHLCDSKEIDPLRIIPNRTRVVHCWLLNFESCSISQQSRSSPHFFLLLRLARLLSTIIAVCPSSSGPSIKIETPPPLANLPLDRSGARTTTSSLPVASLSNYQKVRIFRESPNLSTP